MAEHQVPRVGLLLDPANGGRGCSTSHFHCLPDANQPSAIHDGWRLECLVDAFRMLQLASAWGMLENALHKSKIADRSAEQYHRSLCARHCCLQLQDVIGSVFQSLVFSHSLFPLTKFLYLNCTPYSACEPPQLSLLHWLERCK